jgi:hypothetical protein
MYWPKFMVENWTDDSPNTNSTHTPVIAMLLNLVNCRGIFIDPDTRAVRIYVTTYVKVCFVCYEQQMRICKPIMHIFQHPVTKRNPLWSINNLKLKHNSNSKSTKLY